MANDQQTRNYLGLIAAVLGFGILIFVNLLSEKAFRRIDLTQEGRYSLSEPFQRILNKMDPESPAKVTYYISRNVPGNFVQAKRNILDKLSDIETASRGLIELEVINPERNARARKMLDSLGFVYEIRQMSRDKATFSSVYSSISITYGRQDPVFIPAVQRPEVLEYEIANRVLNLTLNERPIIAILAPRRPAPGGHTPKPLKAGGYDWILANPEQRERFDVRKIDMTENNSIPKDTKLLILISPEELSKRAQYDVHRYLSEGGRVFLIANGWKIRPEQGVDQLIFRAKKTPTGLEDYLNKMGIRFGTHFICDSNNVILPIRSEQFSGAVSHKPLPFYVKIRPENVNQTNPITRFLPGLVMPFPGEMFANIKQANSEGIDLEVLAQTSDESWTVPFQKIISPAHIKGRPATFEKKKTVFVKLEGTFPFPFKGKPIPAWPKDPTRVSTTKNAKPKTTSTPELQARKGLLLVWSCPDSFNRGYYSRDIQHEFQGNVAIIPNVAETAALGDDLIQMRYKQSDVRAIRRLGESKRNLWKLFMLIGMPLLVLAFALIRWSLRRAKQNNYERTFAKTIGPSSFTP